MIRDGARTVHVITAESLLVLPGVGWRAAKMTCTDAAGMDGTAIGVAGGVVGRGMIAVGAALGVTMAPEPDGVEVTGAVVGVAVAGLAVGVGDIAPAGEPQAASKASNTTPEMVSAMRCRTFRLPRMSILRSSCQK